MSARPYTHLAPVHAAGPPSVELALSDDAIERIAAAVAPLVAERLGIQGAGRQDGWLNAERAAEYLSVGRRRIYDLKSMGALEPDGYDGRTPLWRRETLDAYARSNDCR